MVAIGAEAKIHDKTLLDMGAGAGEPRDPRRVSTTTVGVSGCRLLRVHDRTLHDTRLVAKKNDPDLGGCLGQDWPVS